MQDGLIRFSGPNDVYIDHTTIHSYTTTTENINLLDFSDNEGCRPDDGRVQKLEFHDFIFEMPYNPTLTYSSTLSIRYSA